MKPKTRKSRARNFPLFDAKEIPCSEKGFSLLQWGFDTPHGFPRYSIQIPIDAAKQILAWRDLHKLDLELGDYK